MQVPKKVYCEFKVKYKRGNITFEDSGNMYSHYLVTDDFEINEYLISKVKDLYKYEHGICLEEVNITLIEYK